MDEVFSQALASRVNAWEQAAYFLHELLDLPAALLRQHMAAWSRVQGGPLMDNHGSTQPSSRQAALLGAFPFLMYGLICMLTQWTLPFSEFFLWLAFYLVTLIWLVIGWVKGFPRWSYAYLGWSLTLALTWGGAPLVLLIPAVGVALVLTRSAQPLRQLWRAILEDWTRLSFALFSLPVWFILIYGGNKPAHAMLLMFGSTLALSLGAYLHLRSPVTAKRIIALLASLTVAYALWTISENGWNINGNFPQPASSSPAYLLMLVILRRLVSLGIITLLLVVPAVFALFRGRKRQQNI